MDQAAEIARLKAENERLRAELARLKAELARLLGLVPAEVTVEKLQQFPDGYLTEEQMVANRLVSANHSRNNQERKEKEKMKK